MIALYLQRSFGQPFAIENRTGAGSTLGARFVARAAPDGYLLLLGTTSTYVIAPYAYHSAGYDPAVDLAPVAVVFQTAVVLNANPRTGFRTVADVVAAARRPEEVTYASVGSGSLPHVMGELFASLAGIRLTHVPYRGGAPAMNDLIGGQVDLMFEVVANVAQHATARLIVPLMASGPARAPLLPAVPTMTEAGFPGLDLTSWTGFAAPAGTPGEVVTRLNGAINTALGTEEVLAALARLGTLPVGGSPADMAGRMARESAIYRHIIATVGVAVQ